MDKLKLTKKSLEELIKKLETEQSNSVERHIGGINVCRYLLDKFEFEEEKELISGVKDNL